LLRDAGADVMGIALYATLSQVLAALAQAAAGRAADRLSLKGATLVVVVSLWLSIAGLGLFSRSLWGVSAFGALSTAAAWSLSVLIPSLVARAAASHERGRVLGWVHLWWNLGMVLGALAGGALIGWRPGAPFWLAAAVNLVTLAMAARFFQLQREGVGGD
jgi:MFS family permease